MMEMEKEKGFLVPIVSTMRKADKHKVCQLFVLLIVSKWG